MKDLLLSPHFKLSEFERSATATRLGIDNSVPSQYIPALQQLCKEILEPLREFINSSTPTHKGEKERGLLISSGYRCPQLNIKVGGVYSSQHTLGEACDIRIPEYDFTGKQGQRFTNTDILDRWFTWIMNNCDYDQLIKETTDRRIYWIHVSCRANKSKNRHQVIHFMQKGGSK